MIKAVFFNFFFVRKIRCKVFVYNECTTSYLHTITFNLCNLATPYSGDAIECNCCASRPHFCANSARSSAGSELGRSPLNRNCPFSSSRSKHFFQEMVLPLTLTKSKALAPYRTAFVVHKDSILKKQCS